MSEIKYNKLVRDKIPEITKKSGKHCETKVLSDTEYLNMLDRKLEEELEEYNKDKSIEELADLLEVIFAVAEAKGYSLTELEQVRQKKATERGRFKQKILLKKVFEIQ